MAQIQRQSTKNVIYIYLGAAVGFVSNILFSNYLTAEQNGVLALLVSFGGFIGSLANLGFAFAGIRYFPQMRNPEKHHGGYLYASLKYGLIALVLLGVAFLLTKSWWVKPEEHLFEKLYPLAIVVGLGTLLYHILSYYMRFNFNSTTPTLSKEFGQRVLMLVFFVPLIWGAFEFEYYAAFYALIFLSIPLALIVFVKKQGYWYPKNYFSQQSRSFKIDFWKACAYGLITGMGASALLYLDSIMVNSLLTTADTGIYVRNFYFATIIIMASRAVIGIAQTHISEAFKDDDLDRVNAIYIKSCLTQTIIGMLFFIGIWGNIDNIYRILPAEFEAGKYVILFVGLGNLFTMMTGANQLVLGGSPYYRVNTYSIFVLLALAVVLNLVLIPVYGITGAAIATGLSAFLANLYRSVFIYFKYKFQPYNYKYLLVFGFGLVSLFLVGEMPQFENLILDLAFRSAGLFVLFFVPIYLFKVSSDINDLVNKILKRFSLRR